MGDVDGIIPSAGLVRTEKLSDVAEVRLGFEQRLTKVKTCWVDGPSSHHTY